MTVADRNTLDFLAIRLKHVAATACLLSDHSEVDGSSMGEAIAGIADNLREMVERLHGLTAQPSEA